MEVRGNRDLFEKCFKRTYRGELGVEDIFERGTFRYLVPAVDLAYRCFIAGRHIEKFGLDIVDQEERQKHLGETIGG